MGADPEETWLKLSDAAKLLKPLGITDQTVRNWADSGRLKSIRLGPGGTTGHRRIALSSVRDLLEQRGLGLPPAE